MYRGRYFDCIKETLEYATLRIEGRVIAGVGEWNAAAVAKVCLSSC